ncbi:C40 family peptidase [Pseudooceanicola sp. CBS1P-1]|uniref:Phage tail protein n=1 Tax=Pseudooceanicola albus TaxID=2692189 RepID=A0A6L7FYF5_9RHOB|nr:MULTISPECIES: NlpC/P60 family protein [Pseudooceanicola]MBT9382232.1 C40 family peptidase [Pseudooceanicola endophyticus]MXN16775.1 phage tail protein [Pseudooceanicola albus]
MSWSNGYIGLPWGEFGRSRSGADCWGLACIIYQEELGIRLPEYLGYSSAEERGEIAALVSGATSSPLWLPVEGPAIAFDIVVFRRGRLASHVGIVVRHGLMIHMDGEDCAKLADYTGGAWKHRLTGHYRHVERPVTILSEARR